MGRKTRALCRGLVYFRGVGFSLFSLPLQSAGYGIGGPGIENSRSGVGRGQEIPKPVLLSCGERRRRGHRLRVHASWTLGMTGSTPDTRRRVSPLQKAPALLLIAPRLRLHTGQSMLTASSVCELLYPANPPLRLRSAARRTTPLRVRRSCLRLASSFLSLIALDALTVTLGNLPLLSICLAVADAG